MTYKIAIIGSGPSAFYAAQALFKGHDDLKVDMFEKLPTPYGLLRGGVAPDHQQMKTVSKAYDKIASHENFRFFGNVEIGKDIDLPTLKKYYNCVILAIGAETDRKMNIPGEDLSGSYTATEFVAWYNGQPNYQNHQFNLNGSTAIIIGQGNVAVDVTRILSKPVTELQKTDITQKAIDLLKNSRIKDVYMVGRRGPAQAAFTELELKELGHIDGVNLKIHDDLNLSEADLQEVELSSKARKNIKLLKEFKESLPFDPNKKTIHLLFFSSPIEVVDDKNQIKKVVFEKNILVGEAGKQKAQSSGETFEIECDILLRSIGYKGVPFKGLPFDDRKGVIPNDKGQVVEIDGTHVEDTYVTGWIKRGPSGVIGTNRSDSIETVGTCLATLEKTTIKDATDIVTVFNEKNIKFLTYEDWKIIDEYEVKAGHELGKPREKVTSIDKIFEILNK
ncbi:MAG: FAD-dependent oxidoreductase [Candidatus Margulisiibacteriota bacterium]|nr:FAD-dependent oxidoreductase [Candidatus Margulisiibacteriota bacterium]